MKVLSKGTQKAFQIIFVLIILNLLFWLYSLVGLLILGVGPSLITITELFLNNKFEYRKYSVKDGWKIFKKNFVTSNLHFYAFLIADVFLFYDLYIGSQIKMIWMLPISILLIFLIIFISIVGLYTLITESTFEIDFKNAIKLSLYAFFADFKGLMLFIVGAGIIVIISGLWPGLILFLSISTLIVWCNYSSKSWLDEISEKL